MKIVLFALTGFGNKVLEAILKDGHEVQAIFTRKESGPYPYYQEENIASFAAREGISVFESFDWQSASKIIAKLRPELLLVSTFHRIIPENILLLAPRGVNLHPSLLPKYRGPTPIAWVLHNKETVTGVTAHWLVKDADAGEILIQERLAIEADDDEGKLRYKLSVLAAEVAVKLIKKIQENKIESYPQIEKEATYFPKFDRDK